MGFYKKHKDYFVALIRLLILSTLLVFYAVSAQATEISDSADRCRTLVETHHASDAALHSYAITDKDKEAIAADIQNLLRFAPGKNYEDLKKYFTSSGWQAYQHYTDEVEKRLRRDRDRTLDVHYITPVSFTLSKNYAHFVVFGELDERDYDVVNDEAGLVKVDVDFISSEVCEPRKIIISGWSVTLLLPSPLSGDLSEK